MTQDPKTIRHLVWLRYCGHNYYGECYCCNESIDINNWDCSHVIARANGGPDTVENRRPCCRRCNGSMRTRDMREFCKTHHLPGHQKFLNEKIEIRGQYYSEIPLVGKISSDEIRLLIDLLQKNLEISSDKQEIPKASDIRPHPRPESYNTPVYPHSRVPEYSPSSPGPFGFGFGSSTSSGFGGASPEPFGAPLSSSRSQPEVSSDEEEEEEEEEELYLSTVDTPSFPHIKEMMKDGICCHIYKYGGLKRCSKQATEVAFRPTESVIENYPSVKGRINLCLNHSRLRCYTSGVISIVNMMKDGICCHIINYCGERRCENPATCTASKPSAAIKTAYPEVKGKIRLCQKHARLKCYK